MHAPHIRWLVRMDLPTIAAIEQAGSANPWREEDYLDYLRQLESKLTADAVIVADNTGVYRRDVAPYLEYVRAGGGYASREYDFGDDCMEVSVRGAGPT